MSLQEEVVIWDAFRTGSEDAFRQLYDRHYKGLVNYGHRFTPDQPLVESAIQDLFVNLWQKRHEFQSVTSVKNYLYISFRRVLMRILAKENVFVSLSENEENYPFDFSFSPESNLISKERMAELQKKLTIALSNMTAYQREVIYLKYYENLSYDEIAAILGITTKGTYKLVYRAIDALKEQLGNFTLLVLYFVLMNGSRNP